MLCCAVLWQETRRLLLGRPRLALFSEFHKLGSYKSLKLLGHYTPTRKRADPRPWGGKSKSTNATSTKNPMKVREGRGGG